MRKWRRARQDMKKALFLRVLAEQNTHIVCRGRALLRESTTAESETSVFLVVFLYDVLVRERSRALCQHTLCVSLRRCTSS